MVCSGRLITHPGAVKKYNAKITVMVSFVRPRGV